MKLTSKDIIKVVEKIDVDFDRTRTYEFEVEYNNGTVITVNSAETPDLYKSMISDINEFMVNAIRTVDYNCYWNQKYTYTAAEEPAAVEPEKITFEGCTISISSANNDVITISNNQISKNVRVINSSDHIFKVNKKSISAINGARGLFDFFNDRISENFGVAYVRAIIEKVMNEF